MKYEELLPNEQKEARRIITERYNEHEQEISKANNTSPFVYNERDEVIREELKTCEFERIIDSLTKEKVIQVIL